MKCPWIILLVCQVVLFNVIHVDANESVVHKPSLWWVSSKPASSTTMIMGFLSPPTTTTTSSSRIQQFRNSERRHHFIPTTESKNYGTSRMIMTTTTISTQQHQQRRRRRRHSSSSSSSSALFSSIRPENNLIAGICEISFAFSLGVLWSEYSIIRTGCGPIDLSDTLEKICYQGVIISTGMTWFLWIITGGIRLDVTVENMFGPLEESTLLQVRIVEWTNLLTVLFAFLALGLQEYRGIHMDGLSGINVDMCRAIRDLQ